MYLQISKYFSNIKQRILFRYNKNFTSQLKVSLYHLVDIINSLIPLLELSKHNVNSFAFQNLGSDPSHSHVLVQLINWALDQTQSHRLHDHELNMFERNSAFFRNSHEFDDSVTFWQIKNDFQEVHDSDLLIQNRLVLEKNFLIYFEKLRFYWGQTFHIWWYLLC